MENKTNKINEGVKMNIQKIKATIKQNKDKNNLGLILELTKEQLDLFVLERTGNAQPCFKYIEIKEVL